MAIQAKPATAPTGPAPTSGPPGTMTAINPGGPAPQPWAAGGPARNPLDLYNFASQNMPPWAQRAGVSPVAYAQFMQNHPQSPGAMNFAASGAPPSPGGPAAPPMLPNGRPMAMPGGPLMAGPGGLVPGGPPPGPGPQANPIVDGIPPEVLARIRGTGGLSPMVPNEPPQGGGDSLPYGNDAQAREVPPPTPMESMNGGPSQGKPDLQSTDGGPLQAKPAFRPPRPSIPDKHSMPPPTMRRPRPRMAQ